MGNRFLGMPIDTSNTIRLMHEIIASARAKQTTEAFQGLHEASKGVVQRIAKAPMDKALRLQEKDPTVAAAERVSQKFRELNEVLDALELPDPDPMTSLGTSAQRATEAFQGLHEASKDLVDLEIVIPAGYITDPAPFPARPGYMDISEPARRVPMVTEYGVHGNTATFDLIPYTVEQAPISLEHVAIVDKPLTDSEFQEATEQLDRVLRLPWYKRTPALILWLWRLP